MGDTIYAVSTAPGKAGIAVVRISGPRANQVSELFGCPKLNPRQAQLRNLRDVHGDIIDEAVTLFFPEGRSFTGEHVVELQTHGSQAVIAAVLRTLASGEGFRVAEPGEFARRALRNGRLDLTGVEALSDLIDAETELQRSQAVRQLQGGLRTAVARWRQTLVGALALIEADIEFSEDGTEGASDPISGQIERMISEFRDELQGAGGAERLRQGFEVALVGRPNLGKSTLMNYMAGRDISLVTPVAGTTRDVLEVRLDLAGMPITMVDLAGLRRSDDPVECLGMERARQRAALADLRVFIVDGDGPPEGVEHVSGDLRVWAKGDLGSGPDGIPPVSGLTGEGVPALLEEIGDILAKRIGKHSLLTRERHRVALERASAMLCRVVENMRSGAVRHELAAEDLRAAVRFLDSVIGKIDVEDVLDDIFSRFCLGK